MTRLLICTAALLALTASANAQPPLVTSASQMRQGVDYRMNTPSGQVVLHHHYDGKSTTVTTADGSRFTLVSVRCGNAFCIYNKGRLWRRVPKGQ
jgi:hypothetical protein